MTVSIEGTTPGIAVDGTGAVVNVTVTTGAGGGGGVELGETSTTAYRGDRGKTAYDHSQATTGNPHGTTAADVGADPAGTAAGLVDDLSGVSNQSAARSNLGLGTAAVSASTDFAAASHTHNGTQVTIDASGFNGNLTTSDDTVQEVAQKLDDLVIPAAGIPATIIDAKGDLIVGTADNTPARLAAGTDGHVLTLDSAQTAGVKWAAASGGSGTAQVTIVNPFTAGYYITTPHPITVGGTAGGNPATAHTRLVCAPSIVITRTVTIDRLAIVVTNAGDASSVLRLGLWADNGSSRPGTLLAQGTVAGDSTGVKLATVSVTLTPGVYWTGLAWQGGVPTTQPKWQCLNHGAQDMGANFGAVDLSNATRTRAWMYQNSVTGSFSSSPTLTETPAQTAALDVTVPEIALRVAS